MKNLILSTLVGTLALASLAGHAQTQTAAEQVANIDVSQMNALCESAKQTTAQMAKEGKIRLSKKDGGLECSDAAAKYYSQLCSIPGIECERSATFGIIFWLGGAEVNIPFLRLPFVRHSRFDLRGTLGISFVQTEQAGTHKFRWRKSIVFQPAFTTVFEKSSPVAQDMGSAVPQGDLLQFVIGGVSFMLIPSGMEANLSISSIFAEPFSTRPWAEIYKSQIGVVFEGKTPGQSDLNQTRAFSAALTTNLPGIVNSVAGGWTGDNRGHAILVSFYNQTGKIRTENAGIQFSPIYELVSTDSIR